MTSLNILFLMSPVVWNFTVPQNNCFGNYGFNAAQSAYFCKKKYSCFS